MVRAVPQDEGMRRRLALGVRVDREQVDLTRHRDEARALAHAGRRGRRSRQAGRSGKRAEGARGDGARCLGGPHVGAQGGVCLARSDAPRPPYPAALRHPPAEARGTPTAPLAVPARVAGARRVRLGAARVPADLRHRALHGAPTRRTTRAHLGRRRPAGALPLGFEGDGPGRRDQSSEDRPGAARDPAPRAPRAPTDRPQGERGGHGRLVPGGRGRHDGRRVSRPSHHSERHPAPPDGRQRHGGAHRLPVAPGHPCDLAGPRRDARQGRATAPRSRGPLDDRPLCEGCGDLRERQRRGALPAPTG